MRQKKKLDENSPEYRYERHLEIVANREKHLSEMRNGRIGKKYLNDLVLDYKFKKSLDENYPMPTELAEVVLIIIDKMLGSSSWRGYSDDWKEDFRGRAIEHVLKYAHNFDPDKSKSGKNDPYNYFAMIIGNAFIQSWRKCKTYSDNNVILNDDLIYNQNNWEEDQESRPDIQSITPNIDSIDWNGYS